MTVYITIQDVDELLGDTWTAADKKGKAVLQANTWMTRLTFRISTRSIFLKKLSKPERLSLP